jgi:hypothetical protein
MVKKMVRFALSSEYSRLPIRRSDISTKVLGEQGSRDFKTVFEQAQRELRSKFGMEMTELPAREKATVAQRRGPYLFLSFSLILSLFGVWVRCRHYATHFMSIHKSLTPTSGPKN